MQHADHVRGRMPGAAARVEQSNRGGRQKPITRKLDMKTILQRAAILGCLGAVGLMTGCVERRVVYVPTYRAPPPVVVPSAPVGPAPMVPAAPGVAAAPTDPNTPPPAQPAPAPPPPQEQPAVVYQAPPAPMVEVVPVAPGPNYYWVPGYWYWGGTGWAWYRGRYAIRPWHGAVWVGGGWGRHGGRWEWRGGHWR